MLWILLEGARTTKDQECPQSDSATLVSRVEVFDRFHVVNVSFSSYGEGQDGFDW